MKCEGVKAINNYKHTKDCNCIMVIPVLEWVGDGNSRVLGYECPKCGVINLVNGKVWIPCKR